MFFSPFQLLHINNHWLQQFPNGQLWMVLALLAIAIALFIRNKPRMDAVALLMIVFLPFTGVLTIDEALMGFSDSNIVLIAALFVLGDGLARTGVAMQIGDWLQRKAGGNETKLLMMLMVTVALLGSIMSSTAIVAIFIPIIFRICKNSGSSPSSLMMPLSFAALISGMMTLIGTAPNLVVNAALKNSNLEGFGFFSITPIGVAILTAGLIYMLFVGRFIPNRKAPGSNQPTRPGFADWIEKYQLSQREYRVQINAGSLLANRQLQDLDMRKMLGINLLAIERSNKLVQPTGDTFLRAEDVLLMDVWAKNVEELAAQYGLTLLPLQDQKHYLTHHAQSLGMAEAIVTPESSFIGASVLDNAIRDTYRLTVVGLCRNGKIIAENWLEEELKAGDTLLLTGFWKDLQQMNISRKNLLVLHMPAEEEEVLLVANKGPIAIGILALVVITMVAGWLPNVQAVLAGCLLMGLAGVVNMNSAYQSISWKTIVLIVGMMPFSLALQRTGGVEMAADAMVAIIGDGSPRLALGLLFVTTALMGLFLSNTATAVLMAPVGISMAAEMNISPYPFAMTVAIAASAAFMTPVSSPVNTLVMAPGNYRFADFMKIGIPFVLIVLAICLLVVPLVIPF